MPAGDVNFLRTFSFYLVQGSGDFFITLQTSARTICCVVGQFGTIKEQVFAHRGITLSSTSTRRAPNAFHLMRQADILQRCGQGNSEQQLKDVWFHRS